MKEKNSVRDSSPPTPALCVPSLCPWHNTSCTFPWQNTYFFSLLPGSPVTLDRKQNLYQSPYLPEGPSAAILQNRMIHSVSFAYRTQRVGKQSFWKRFQTAGTASMHPEHECVKMVLPRQGLAGLLGKHGRRNQRVCPPAQALGC